MTDHAIDPELVPLLELLPVVTDFSTLDRIVDVRRAGDEMFPAVAPRPDVIRADITIPGPSGAPDIPIRIHRPTSDSSSTKPAFVEIHGGGFMIGSRSMVDGFCDLVAAAAGAPAVDWPPPLH